MTKIFRDVSDKVCAGVSEVETAASNAADEMLCSAAVSGAM